MQISFVAFVLTDCLPPPLQNLVTNHAKKHQQKKSQKFWIETKGLHSLVHLFEAEAKTWNESSNLCKEQWWFLSQCKRQPALTVLFLVNSSVLHLSQFHAKTSQCFLLRVPFPVLCYFIQRLFTKMVLSIAARGKQ